MAVDVSIVTSGHDVADARLHRVCAALQRGGLRVEVLALGDPAGAPPGAEVTTRPRGSVLARPVTALRYAARARGSVLLALDPDSLLACLLVGRLRGRRVVADVHEDYAALLRDRAWARGWRGRAAEVVAHTATAAARRADLVVVADDHVPPSDASARLVVRNLPDLHMLPEPSGRATRPRALYVGDVRASRGLWAMLEAVERSPAWELDLVGPVAPADERRLAEELARRGLGDRVRLHGRQAPRAAWRLAEGAWCGLALLEDTPAFRDALPSKLYEYLGCGLPVVVSDLPRQAALVSEARGGAVVPAGPGAGPAAAEVLSHWLEDPAELDRARSAARDWRATQLHDDPYAVLSGRVAALARSGG
ncbi:MAG TPA: glycosyltransferase [Dermatophilaceae bacterium]|nr:glycosyltransferase [Dermatophilaceae bacterium]